MGVIYMDQIEKLLLEEKQKIDSMKVPVELEDRLCRALYTAGEISKRREVSWVLVAAVCMGSIAGHQYGVLAYYGKKLFGFDDIISGTLNDLNTAGIGRTIAKKITLPDGTTLTI